MSPQNILLLKQHPFVQGLHDDYQNILQHLVVKETYVQNQVLFQEGERADRFFLIHQGELSIEILNPGQGLLPIQTVGAKEIVGWSWFFPPHYWTFHGRAKKDLQVFSLEGSSLKKECESYPAFGFELVKRLTQTMVDRLKSTRLQILDIYGIRGKVL